MRSLSSKRFLRPMLFFGLPLWLIFSAPAHGTKDQKCIDEFNGGLSGSLPGSSPLQDTGLRFDKVTFDDAAKSALRAEANDYYSYAKEFAQELGLKFGKLVQGRITPGQKTTLVFAMGGAEHLGTLLEA